MLETANQLDQANILSNETSSLHLPPGYSISLYDSEEGWWKGHGKTYYSDPSSVGGDHGCINLPAEWNDKVASLDMWKGQVY